MQLYCADCGDVLPRLPAKSVHEEKPLESSSHSKVAPASARIAVTFSSERLTWASIPSTSSPVAGSAGICPDTCTKRPERAPWE
jgi:hypothetical protein